MSEKENGSKGLNPIPPQGVTRGLQPITPAQNPPSDTGPGTAAGIQPIVPTDFVKPPTEGGSDKK
jgi:hypothetical protein